jgi:TetR/AcrR family acrAB operon transcriptional repressor
MRKTKVEAEITRKKLLDAALKVFSKKGYVSTTLDDIAREAGVTRGALYWHFKGGKPDIFKDLINERTQGVQLAVNAVIVEGGSALHMLERILVRTLEYLVEDDEFRAVQELAILKTEVVPELEDTMKDKYRLQHESVRSFADLVKKAQEEGDVRKDIDPNIAAVAAISIMSGVTVVWMMDNTLFPLKEYATPIIHTFIDGLKPQNGTQGNL